KEVDPYLAQFTRFETEAKQPAWLFPIRKAGMARFAELGFPTVQQEDWRFTNVAPVAQLPFKPVFNGRTDGLSAKTLSQFTFATLRSTRLVFVDGCFAKELSAIRPLPSGVKVGSLAAALASDAGLLQKHLSRYARSEDNAFAALNTAFFTDGA